MLIKKYAFIKKPGTFLKFSKGYFVNLNDILKTLFNFWFIKVNITLNIRNNDNIHERMCLYGN